MIKPSAMNFNKCNMDPHLIVGEYVCGINALLQPMRQYSRENEHNWELLEIILGFSVLSCEVPKGSTSFHVN